MVEWGGGKGYAVGVCISMEAYLNIMLTRAVLFIVVFSEARVPSLSKSNNVIFLLECKRTVYRMKVVRSVYFVFSKNQ